MKLHDSTRDWRRLIIKLSGYFWSQFPETETGLRISHGLGFRESQISWLGFRKISSKLPILQIECPIRTEMCM